VKVKTHKLKKIQSQVMTNKFLNPKNFIECESIACTQCRNNDDLRPGYTLDQSCHTRMSLKEIERLSGIHRT